MPQLILVKHAMPLIDRERPSAEWPLAPESRPACEALAEQLAAYSPARVVASQEPKAAESGRIVAERLGLPWQTAPGLHEHERSAVGWLGRAEFEAAARALFSRPRERVFGDESAAQALARFQTAVDAVLDQAPGETIVIATHGTVITLLVSAHNPVEPFDFWSKLALPSFVVLELPGYILIA